MPADTPSLDAPRRWPRRLLLTLGGLVFLLWLTPVIVGWTPLVPWLCARTALPLNATIHVGSASLGWFSPVRLYGVELRDPAGKTIVQVPRIHTDRCLLMLLFDRRQPGSILLDRPTIDLTFGKTSSNLETVLAGPSPEPDESKSAQAQSSWSWPPMRIEVVEGTLNLHDTETRETWPVRSVALSAILVGDEARTVHINVAATTHDGTEPGTLSSDIVLQGVGTPALRATIKGRFTSVPVALAGIIARRYSPGAELLGSLQGNGTFNFELNDGKPCADFTGDLVANNVILNTPWLAETLTVERLRLPCSLRLEDCTLTADHAELECEFGKATIRGSLDFAAEWRDVLAQPDFDLSAEVNLQKLGERLPKTLHLHHDLRIESGQIIARCKSQLKDGGLAWQGQLRMTELVAARRNQTITWPEPIAVHIEVRDPHKGVPLIDHVRCSARFLRLEGSATADGFTLRAEADLQRLAEPLGQFIDLSAVKLAGKLNGTASVRRLDAGRFLVEGDAQLKHMNLTGLTTQVWQEESASMKFNARGSSGSAGRQLIESVDAVVKLGADRITVRLLETIPDLAAGPWGAFALSLDGDLERWQRRVRCLTMRLDAWQLAGTADVQVQLRPSAHALDCASASVTTINLRMTGPGVWIREPTLHLQAAARWDMKSGDLELTQMKVSCPTAALNSGKLTILPAKSSLRGAATITADLSRLRKWTQDPRVSPGTPMHGTLVGRIEVQADPARSNADFDLGLKNFVHGDPASPDWREAELKCVGRGVYDAAQDALRFEKLSLTSAAFRADLEGTVANLASTQDIDLTGTLAYDLEKLEPQLRPILGKDVKIAGKESRAFQVAGPLCPKGRRTFKELKGSAGLHWTALQAHGCEFGPAELKAVVQQGWLQSYPIATTFSGGKLRLQPNLKFEPAPNELILLAGPVIEKAKLTPKMCAGALGHALPILANGTEVEGTLSLTLEGGRVPLGNPASGEIKGTLTLHHARAGPNPILRELSALLKMPVPNSVVKDCQVPFHMANGKVHHSNLEIALGQFTVRSSGAVGLDGTLALVVEMPIPPQLAAAARLTPTQAKQMIRIPIGGTLEHPRIDPRALESLPATLGRSLLENQLNRLLPKR